MNEHRIVPHTQGVAACAAGEAPLRVMALQCHWLPARGAVKLSAQQANQHAILNNALFIITTAHTHDCVEREEAGLARIVLIDRRVGGYFAGAVFLCLCLRMCECKHRSAQSLKAREERDTIISTVYVR